MSSRNRTFAPGHYCHIYNRGINREKIFFSKENYLHYLRLLGKYIEDYLVTVIAYCLMPNHYHFLLRQDGDTPLSKFMKAVLSAYVQPLNKQLERKGPLFEGRFRHVYVDRDEYILHLCRYIHFNPVTARYVRIPEKWIFSNYQEWIKKRQGNLKDSDFISTYFDSPQDYERFVLKNQLDEKLKKSLEPYLLDESFKTSRKF